MSNMVGGKVLTWDEKVQALKYNDSFNEFGSGGGRATVPASERAKYDQNQKNLYASMLVTDPYFNSGNALSDYTSGRPVVSPNGYSVDSNRINPSTPNATPSTPNTSAIARTLAANPVKTAPIDTVLFNDDSMSIEIMADLIFEDIGGHELINIARNDIINGQQISYTPIKNLGLIQQKYNPNNILGLQATSEKYFANFPIKFEEKVPIEGNGPNGSNVYFEAATGDLIIEGVNLNKDELFEVEVSLNGTIYEADFGATTS